MSRSVDAKEGFKLQDESSTRVFSSFHSSEWTTCPATCVSREYQCRVSTATANSATERRLFESLGRVRLVCPVSFPPPLTRSSSFRKSSDPRGHRSGISRAGRPGHNARLQLRFPSQHRGVRPSRGAHRPSRVGIFFKKAARLFRVFFDICFFFLQALRCCRYPGVEGRLEDGSRADLHPGAGGTG